MHTQVYALPANSAQALERARAKVNPRLFSDPRVDTNCLNRHFDEPEKKSSAARREYNQHD